MITLPGPLLPPSSHSPTHSLSLLLGHTPLGHEVVLVVVLDAAPAVVEEVRERRVHADVAIEVLMGLVEHAAVVARVNHVPPTVLRGVDVHLGHALHTHLLEVPVALQPADPVSADNTARPDDGGPQPEVHRPTFVWRHHRLLNTAINLGVRFFDDLRCLRRK